MSRLDLAKSLCKAAHTGQYDRGGVEYYLHPFKVADMCKKRVDKIVAYLHDVPEDTKITIDDLRKFGFSRRVINAIIAITHIKTMSYPEYLKIVKKNKIATRVKIADLTHNSDITRIKNPTVKDTQRCRKYIEYMQFLQK